MTNADYYEMEAHFCQWVLDNPEKAAGVFAEAIRLTNPKDVRWFVTVARIRAGYKPVNNAHEKKN